jgi:hypothetical protein
MKALKHLQFNKFIEMLLCVEFGPRKLKLFNPLKHIAFRKAKGTLNQPKMIEKMIAENSSYNSL